MTHTLASLAHLIGTQTTWHVVSGIRIPVTILDVRVVWNRVDFKVTPVGGKGDKWVASESLAIG